jgi:hypothetical protein
MTTGTTPVPAPAPVKASLGRRAWNGTRPFRPVLIVLIVVFVALALTQPEYIVDKYGLREQNWVVWALLARNAALVATFVFLAAQLREGIRRT